MVRKRKMPWKRMPKTPPVSRLNIMTGKAPKTTAAAMEMKRVRERCLRVTNRVASAMMIPTVGLPIIIRIQPKIPATPLTRITNRLARKPRTPAVATPRT
jgi:hypothetical protein